MLFAFLLLFSTASARIVWNELKVHSPLTQAEEASIGVTVSTAKSCLYDEFSISWRAKRDIGIPEFNTLQLSVSSSGSDVLFTTKLSDTIEIAAFESADQTLGEYIQCKDDPYFCVPTIKGVVVNTDSSKVRIEFDQDVSQPAILILDQLHTYLDTHPHLEHDANATWIEARTLELELHKLDLERIVEMHSNQETVY
ncbi:hypothetical protein EON65_46565, partial [archaeon]